MKATARLVSRFAGACLLLAGSVTAQATMVSFSLDVERSGSGDALSAPVIVTLDDRDTPGTVLLTIDLSGLTMATEFMSGLYLNFDPANDSLLSALTLTAIAGPAHSGFTASSDCCKPGGMGDHDIQIDFPTSNRQNGAFRLNGGEIYLGEFSDGGLNILTAADFAFLSSTASCAIARMQGLGTAASGSGWFDCGVEPDSTADVDVSEPATLALLGIGLLGIAVFHRRRDL